MKARALVVDDEREFADVLAERLRIKGYGAEPRYSGPEALDKIRNGAFDIVILDLVMPEMDGISVLDEIKRLRPTVEVVMLSGKATREDAVEGIKRGAFEHMDKPCDHGTLVAKIEDAHLRKLAQEDRIRLAMERIRRVAEDAHCEGPCQEGRRPEPGTDIP